MKRWRYLQPEMPEYLWWGLTAKTHDQAHLNDHGHAHLEQNGNTGLVRIQCNKCRAYVILERTPTTSRGHIIGGKALLETKCDPGGAFIRRQKQHTEAVLMEYGETP